MHGTSSKEAGVKKPPPTDWPQPGPHQGSETTGSQGLPHHRQDWDPFSHFTAPQPSRTSVFRPYCEEWTNTKRPQASSPHDHVLQSRHVVVSPAGRP
ncbi:hypothetical protein MRX96_028882 [Rhipicephalus microplus]